VDNFVAVTVSEANEIADRKKVIAALVEKNLLPQPPDGVMLEAELKALFAKPPWHARLRSVDLKMPSVWSNSVDWKAAFKQAKCFGFLEDSKRDALGDTCNKYRWWQQVKDDKGALPVSETVHHYHPIALILAIAYP